MFLVILFLLQFGDLPFQLLDGLLGIGDRGLATALFLPALDALPLLLDSTPFRPKLLAQLAVFFHIIGHHDELHSACFAGSIFSGTMLSEITPFVAGAGHSVLVVVAHFDRTCEWVSVNDIFHVE